MNLEINAYKPDEVWQRHSGERVEHRAEGPRELIYPRNLHLHIRGRTFKYGLVDNINPAITNATAVINDLFEGKFRDMKEDHRQGKVLWEGWGLSSILSRAASCGRLF